MPLLVVGFVTLALAARPADQALVIKLRAGVLPVGSRAHFKLGHVGLLLALARPFRGRALVLSDLPGSCAGRLAMAKDAKVGCDQKADEMSGIDRLWTRVTVDDLVERLITGMQRATI